ncbi:hypothetical protein [Sulfurimonas sp.]|uniref:hypothetical protein n=1 Tax=Sulfurimonas sp. TaxID=2022749 RepID=UPI0025E29EE5|nr:hypothetical protein [Sulfurimonas sp.]
MIKKIILALLVLSSVANAELFKSSNVSLGLSIGNGNLTTVEDGEQNYTILGFSAEYFVQDNLSVSLGVMSWLGATPTLKQVTTTATYYVPLDQEFRPYFGGFARQTYVSDGYEDYESYGGRLGIAMILSPNSYVSFGVVSEHQSSCAEWQDSCSSTYPELVFGASF